jgi:hypothetical protein
VAAVFSPFPNPASGVTERMTLSVETAHSDILEPYQYKYRVPMSGSSQQHRDTNSSTRVFGAAYLSVGIGNHHTSRMTRQLSTSLV